MGGRPGWEHDPREGMLARQIRPDDGRPTFLPQPRTPMPLGMKVVLWLTAIWVVGVVLVVLSHRFVRDLSCMFDATQECRRSAANASTNVTLIGFVLLVLASVVTIVVFEVRRDKRR